MRRLELWLGGHLTTGVIELYNLLSRLYSSFEAAIVPDLTSGVCLLRKSCVSEAGVVPRPLDAEAALAVASGACAGCIPNSEPVGDAGLMCFGAVSTGAVPDVSGAGLLNYAVRGCNATEPFVQSVQAEILHMLGNAHSSVEVELSKIAADLDKWLELQSAVSAHCGVYLSQQKSGGGENSVMARVEASAFAARYRKLYEADPITLEEMDEMTLDDLDYTIVDS